MDLLFVILGWASIPLLVVSVVFLVRQWHHDQRMTVRRLAQPVVLAGVSLWLHAWLLNIDLSPIRTWLPLLAGGVAGVAISRGEDLRLEAEQVVSTKTAWSYLVWAAGFAITQSVVMAAPESASTAVVAVWATTGLTAGEHLGLLQRRHRLRRPTAHPTAPVAAGLLLLAAGAWALTAGADVADAQDTHTIADVAAGEVPGLAARVAGSGLTYKGDSIELFLDNTTGSDQIVHVPIGTRFVPTDTTVQTMHAAGDERIVVPPGGTRVIIRAFCGNRHLAAPGTGTSFTVEKPDRDSREVAVLRRAHELFERGEVDDDDIQDALWWVTDEIPVDEGSGAEQITSGPDDVPDERERGASGVGAVAPSGLVALQTHRRRRDGDGGDGGGEPGPPEGPPPLVDENGNVLRPDENGLYDQYVDGEWRKVTREEAIELIRDAQHWQRVNEADRRRALEQHDEFADQQWEQFVDRSRQRAEAERARAAAEAAERKWRLDTSDRLETVALRHGYHDIIKWLGDDGNSLPTAEQLAKLREFLGRRMADDAAMSRYFDGKSDFDVFAEGCQDDVAWMANKIGSTIAGPAGGSIAEFLVRNPEVPLRIALAIKTAGISEVPFLYGDIQRGLNAAADAKLAEQNLELTSGEMAWEVAKVGLWEIGGRIGGDVISSVLSGKGVGGAYTGLTGGADDVAEAAGRASRTAADETGDRFVQRVKDRIAGRTAPPMNTELPMRFTDASRAAPEADAFIRRVLREGDEIPLNHMHETGLTVKQVRNAGRMCREEGVEALGRTTNMDSMRHIRDGTGVPKPLTVKAKTLKELDTYLHPDIKPGDEGLVGFFEPVKPDLGKVPAGLQNDVMKRYTARLEEYNHLKPDIDRLIANGDVAVQNGKLVDAATGKPFAGDWDAVMFRDAGTGRVIGPGPRYEYLKQRWINEVGGQHGAEVNVVDDITSRFRPGTPEYDRALHKAEELKATLQQSHSSGKEVVVQVGPDGALRRGPVGADIDLSPEAGEFATEVQPAQRGWPLFGSRAGNAGAAVGGELGGTFTSERT